MSATIAAPILLTPAQVAERLGLARQTLAAWRSRGTGLPYIKVGSAVRYRLEDVAAWVEANLVEVAA